MDSVAPGVCEGTAAAGVSPAVIPTTPAITAAAPISDAIFLRAFILVHQLFVGRGRPGFSRSDCARWRFGDRVTFVKCAGQSRIVVELRRL